MHNKQCGFSLLEVMISFVLIGVGALGLVKLQAYVEQKADYAIHSIEALNLAEQKLEWFRTRGATASSAIAVANFDGDIAAGSSAHPPYTLTWSVPATALSGALKTVRVQTTWQDRFGKTHLVELNTMISKYSEFDM
ncbi:type IV pilin [Vibrio vulnificus]|uniref:Prepilin-type N-terminal cleavage/methylation domain-containing protein n=2 Tax=Vibrio vulnificus TaxID=672 RepID=A0AAW4HES8_VIBVL|nr:prepilin-type N-terminal cleavage/methylation domain-containing protein [Vibrio vulnificus]EGQ7693798.1 prepilin-type N-terminal cleavage/methylation domain-containing protein [Vibrio vulnificus]EGQ9311231.1 prepilin-type N-terminal cleavage/methylation domain-containing protein [Vibrio vulnificus]EGQ9313669.1 prepilin-type N-terminal cleavage/methylation domain-containing protein [Vibrio vulnificus]EGR0206594.1 prepilin-type N-terminal cleavage/methylation domain-containing protein [Vibrio 